MKIVDYDQTARFEAAMELLNNIKAILRTYENKDTELTNFLEKRALEINRESQLLKPTDDKAVAEIIAIYGPLARSYYSDIENFVMTKEFIETRTSYDKEN